MRGMQAALGVTICMVATSCAIRTTEEAPLAVVQKRFAAVARHDLDAIAALYAENAVETSPAFCADRSGPEGARRTYGELFRNYPGITADEPVYLVTGNRVAVQFFARLRKPDGTIAFEIPLANFLTVERGRITKDETYFDTKGQPCS